MSYFISRFLAFRGDGLRLVWKSSCLQQSLKSQCRRRCSGQSSGSGSGSSAKTSSSAFPDSSEDPPQKLSLFARFKQMYKDYYYVLIPVHLVTSLGWFGSFYHASQSGVDIAKYMKKMGLSDNLVSKVTESGMGHIAVAYALYKIATPARYAVTLGGTTWSINKLQRLGYIKPAKEIISNSKKYLKDKQAKNK